MNDALIQALLLAPEPSEKATIVAEFYFDGLPRDIALVARYCTILHWFDQDIVKALVQATSLNEDETKDVFEQIISLPFTETLAWGSAFHNLTREGLIKRYSLFQPKLLRDAAELSSLVYRDRESYGMTAAEAFFCYLVAGKLREAMDILDQLLEEAIQRHDWSYISGLERMQKEAEQLPFVQPLLLKERHWIALGMAQTVLNRFEIAVTYYNKAITINPTNRNTYMLLGAIYVEQLRYEEAIAMYTYVIQHEPSFVQPYINRGIIYFRQHQYEKAIQNFSRAIQVDSDNSEVYVYYIQALTAFFQYATTSNNLVDDYIFRHIHTAEAVQNFSRAIQMNSDNVEAYAFYIQALTAFFQASINSGNPLERFAFRQLYTEKGPLLQQPLELNKETLGLAPPEIANYFAVLAALYIRQGRYQDAEPLLQQALAIREKVLGPEHPDTAQSLNGIAVLHIDQGRYQDAEPLLQRALAIREKVLGPEHPDTAQSLHDLAVFYTIQDKHAEAEVLYQRALAIREKVLGPEHPDTAQSLNKLAILYTIQDKHAEAEVLYQRALAIREKVLGLEHPDTAQSLNNLAVLYYVQKKYLEASSLYQRALYIREQVLGSEHPDVAESLNNLALLYNDQNKFAEAEALYHRALAIYVQVLKLENPDTAQVLNNLAALSYKQSRNAEALILCQRALTLCEQTLGISHSRTVAIRKNYEILVSNRGDSFGASGHSSIKGHYSTGQGNA